MVLFKAMLRAINNKFKLTGAIEQETAALLMDYAWPGNARELKNLVERLAIITGQFNKETSALPVLLAKEMSRLKRLAVRPGAAPATDNRLTGIQTFLPENDAGQLLAAPISRQELADRLGISRTTLWRRIKAVEERNGPLSGN